MIGGTDLTLKRVLSSEQLLTEFRKTWPDLVFEQEGQELTVYRDVESCGIVYTYGVTEDVEDRLIYIPLDSDSTHFVVSNMDSQTYLMVELLRLSAV